MSTTNQSWGGRFSEGPTQRVARYTDSQRYDRNLYAQDIVASKAHARMLCHQGILTQAETDAIIDGLDRIFREIDLGIFTWKPELEDVHMNIESRLTELIGDDGKKLHTGRSRNDQVGLTFRLFVADNLTLWKSALLRLIRVLCERARTETGTILPGLTHMQPAQPIALSHHLLAYAWMFKRDFDRITDAHARVAISPLGAAALAGTTYPLEPMLVAKEVGFEQIYDNSLDAVSDRDFVIEANGVASIIMMHLSRLCEELIFWANPNFAYIRLPDAYSTGSSIMPQKKNPDICELMRGKTGRVYGHLMAILTTMKALPLAYNRDMQEDKEGFLDTTDTVIESLAIMSELLQALTFCSKAMEKACRKGYLNATELADYLVSKGIPFREAHHLTGLAVAKAESLGLTLEELTITDFHAISPLIDMDLYPLLDPAKAVERRETPGGTGPNSVARQIGALEQWLKNQA